MKRENVRNGMRVNDTTRNLSGTINGDVRQSRDTAVVWIRRDDNGMPALSCVADLEPAEATGMDTLRSLLDLG